jgi:hypothetical protein
VRRPVLAIATLALTAIVALPACDGGGSTAAGRDRRTTTTTGSGGPSTTTVAGANGVSASVPAVFPVDVPLPQHLGLESAVTVAGDDQSFRLEYALGSTSPGDAMDAYETRLDTAGFAVGKIAGGSVANDAHPSPLRADGHGRRLVVRVDDTTLTLTVDRA